MFVYRIYTINEHGKIAFREDLPIEADAADAIARAEAMASNCIVELWRGGNLLATFRPEQTSSSSWNMCAKP